MSNTLLERTRQLHEDIERSERLAAQDLKRTMTRYKDRLQQDHRTKRFIDEIQECSRKLVRSWLRMVANIIRLLQCSVSVHCGCAPGSPAARINAAWELAPVSMPTGTVERAGHRVLRRTSIAHTKCALTVRTVNDRSLRMLATARL